MLKLVAKKEMAKMEIPKFAKVVDDIWLPDGAPSGRARAVAGRPWLIHGALSQYSWIH
jgi:hypothetical protein